MVEDKSIKVHLLSLTIDDEPQLRTSGVTIDPSKHNRKLWPNQEVVYCLNEINSGSRKVLENIQDDIKEA